MKGFEADKREQRIARAPFQGKVGEPCKTVRGSLWPRGRVRLELMIALIPTAGPTLPSSPAHCSTETAAAFGATTRGCVAQIGSEGMW